MKELRFRAWEKNEKRFIYFELFRGANKHTPPIFKEAELEEWKQFTNLYDKNHREICEGDIVKCHFWNSMWFDTIEVIKIDPMDGCDFCLKTSLGGKDEIWEIIGNIYENPELLKENK